jgi:DNA modification methylase
MHISLDRSAPPWYTRAPQSGTVYRTVLLRNGQGAHVRGQPGLLARMSTPDFLDTLIYGDNLEVLQRFIGNETVDLIYLDPPFNKNKAYSAIFRDESGRTSDAQLATLEDYWHWGPTPERHYVYLTNGELHGGKVPHGVSALIGALHTAIRPSPMLAYLVEMATRLVELHRVLKPTGSIYLHCDPTASHYLKLLLDALFGPANFRNEFVWQRAPAHVDARRGGAVHDTILFYTRSDQYVWNKTYQPYSPDYVAAYYRYREPNGRRFMSADLSGPGQGPPRYFGPERGDVEPPHGRCWMYDQTGIDRLVAEDRIFWTRNGIPRLKKYLDEAVGMPISDVWTDVQGLRSWHRERIGWPTQKPLGLLNRIIAASSNEGDLVLDPFCGCGTAVEAAQQANRHWIGIDISNLAVEVIGRRMNALGVDVAVFDWPTELDGVKRMVEAPGGRHRFEAWALTRLNAQPVRELGGRGADQGIDGRIPFTLPSGKVETIIVSIKSGHVGSPALRDLKGTVQREHAAMGLLFTLQESTEPMRREATTAGFYRAPAGAVYPKIVIHTVRELLSGHLPDLPSRFGVQADLWQSLPTASRAVRLRPARHVPGPIQPVVAYPTETADKLREDYAAGIVVSPEPPRSPRMSRRDRTAPLPSPGSGDTD